MSGNTTIKLRIPQQDLQDFSAFQLNADAALQWAENLPVANTRAVAQSLRETFEQLNRVEIPPEQRFEIIEALRPSLQVTLSNLSKRYLNQPLIMPEEPRQVAALAESLMTEACSAYTIVAIHTVQRRDSVRKKNPAQLVCESIHRAVRLAGRKLLQTFQLYRPVERHGWLVLHQLYALAEANKLTGQSVSDPLGGSGTVTAAYLQALVLGCCKPNQLRQSDLAAVYRGLQEWCGLLQVREDEQDSLFLLDLDSDQPPMYSSLYSQAPGPRTRYLDTAPVVGHLEKLKAIHEKSSIVFDRDTTISPNLLDHVINSLGSMSMRNFTRREVDKTISISLGLSSAHYYLAGQRSFEELLFGDDYQPPPAERVLSNPFLKPSLHEDKWQRANPDKDAEKREYAADEEALEHEVEVDEATRAALEHTDNIDDPELPAAQRYPLHTVALVDISPGGYCFEWSSELPGDIKTGDIIGVREDPAGGWAVAVIRWVNQIDNSNTQIGLEMLSPRAVAYGARLQLKKGEESAAMRVLLLPEIKLVGQPHTLITPRVGFRERQKIILMKKGEEFYIQLLRQIAITGTFAQFDFRYIKQLGEVLAEDKTRPLDSTFDSLWTNI